MPLISNIKMQKRIEFVKAGCIVMHEGHGSTRRLNFRNLILF
jgi:hypothetical protein